MPDTARLLVVRFCVTVPPHQWQNKSISGMSTFYPSHVDLQARADPRISPHPLAPHWALCGSDKAGSGGFQSLWLTEWQSGIVSVVCSQCGCYHYQLWSVGPQWDHLGGQWSPLYLTTREARAHSQYQSHSSPDWLVLHNCTTHTLWGSSQSSVRVIFLAWQLLENQL